EQYYRSDLATEAVRAIEGIPLSNEDERNAYNRVLLHYALQFGDLDQVPALAARLHMSTSERLFLGHPSTNLITFGLHYAGCLREAEEIALAAFHEAERTGSRTLAHWYACALAEWRLDEGNLVESKQWLSTADELQGQLRHPHFTAGGIAVRIRIALLE